MGSHVSFREGFLYPRVGVWKARKTLNPRPLHPYRPYKPKLLGLAVWATICSWISLHGPASLSRGVAGECSRRFCSGFSEESISLKKNRTQIRMHCRPKKPACQNINDPLSRDTAPKIRREDLPIDDRPKPTKPER